MIAKHGQPIKKRRLLEPGDACKTRRDPVTGRKHSARNLGVTRLVGAEKGKSPQTVNEKKQAK